MDEGRAETKLAGRKGSSSSSPAAEEDDDGTASARSANPQQEAGAPLILALALGLGVTVIPATACRFAPPGWTPAACVDLQQSDSSSLATSASHYVPW
ncbi:hypothetical protein [Oryza sativa Japonica Group]|uniref:Uncharacterized protein n=1 Tax=Oryza sativa subsp. japonica TaxID=39947 RepID=Q5QMA7_ORYSJ|nr:hypothetical protein [Oryza sativa Japonica Group]